MKTQTFNETVMSATIRLKYINDTIALWLRALTFCQQSIELSISSAKKHSWFGKNQEQSQHT